MGSKNDDSPAVVCLISLGCSKNTVDSECLLGALAQNGIMIAEDPSDADIALVNTCGFIHDAREETAEMLEQLASLKAAGKLKAVAALGCLVERVGDCPELASFLDAADARVSFAEYPRLPEICRELVAGAKAQGTQKMFAYPHRPPPEFMRFLNSPRARIGSPHTAYLKISEGCSNVCRFCSIPRIRGLQVSRPMEELIVEAQALVNGGAREINLIAQDTTSYGRDLYGEARIVQLLQKLSAAIPHAWIRMLYAYPAQLTDELMDLLASAPNLCPYLDLPLQHISDSMLKTMGRGMSRKQTLDLLDRIRERMPAGAIRTTFIVGFPGETEANFAELLDLVREERFTHMGVFSYSPEPGTPAAKLSDDVPMEVKLARRDALMKAQLEVSRSRLRKMIGQQVEVMIDGFVSKGAEAPRGTKAFGRSRLDAPEVDGLIFLKHYPNGAQPGDRFTAKITASLDYDLIATMDEEKGR